MKEFDFNIVNLHSKKDILDKIEEMRKINTHTEVVIKKLQEMLKEIEEEETILEKERKIYEFLKRNQDYPITFTIDWIITDNYCLKPGTYKILYDCDNYSLYYSYCNEIFNVRLSALKELRVIYEN